MSEEEKKILKFWKENKIFEHSIENRKNDDKFVFFEGPPTANGKPGIHHVEARAFKDIILRYKTMRGFFVPRVAGWDTHGLPVEVEVEKELGLKSKKDILSYGVAEFNKKCRESVWKYKELWENLTERMGFWIDMKNAYITYENSYIEKLWGIIKEFAKNKLLYEDYKVLPWCARCGTPISSHELAQGYQKTQDSSLFIKFKSKNEPNSYFLVWTTTPWTLPGNTALAVNPKIDYVFAKKEKEIFILADARLQVLGSEHEIIKRIKGKELIGQEYESLYKNNAPYKIIGGDFVSLEDGSGIVHIAPAFGDDDFQVGKKNNLPVLQTTNEKGEMATPGYPWDGQFFKKADLLIKNDLKNRGLVFGELSYEHDYPFCWRCKTPLMYFARKAWWVDVNKIRKNLLKNNESINWHPDYLKHGRFGEWLKEEKNWAFSRERFWGTPLPIWKCQNCKKQEVVGSISELQEKSCLRNNFIFMRHGEADHVVMGLQGPTEDTDKFTSHITEKGKKEVETTAKALRKKIKNLDVIIHSTLVRTKETAEIVASYFKNVQFEERGDIKDINLKNESREDVKKRMLNAVRGIDRKFNGKNILIVSHGDPLWILGGMRKDYPATGQLYGIDFPALPLNENGNVDLHKPYIDEIKLKCGCGEIMERVTEVVDAWFDSGSMPFASEVSGYPADYIVEAIDQTRGWFYSLLAVATLLGKKVPYKNVISIGHLLDQKGKKMSKSLGNIVDPFELIEKYGADAIRWYFFTINQPWDSNLFKEDDVKDAQRRFFLILENVVNFLKMYEVGNEKLEVGNEKLIINKWVLANLNQLINQLIDKLDKYDIVGAARDIEYFVTEDLSRWYVRRIRNVMKPAESSPASNVSRSDAGRSNNQAGKEKKETESVLRFVLVEISKILAPFAPFISEHIYKELGGEKESVHLEEYLRGKGQGASEKEMLEKMNVVRQYVNFALKLRQVGNIKVRQPLQLLTIDEKHKKLGDDYLNLIKEEVNVKEIVFADFGSQLDLNASLDTNITLELKEEGILRDLIREIQSARKNAGLKPQDKVTATISAPADIANIAQKFSDEIKKETNSKNLDIHESGKLNIVVS